MVLWAHPHWRPHIPRKLTIVGFFLGWTSVLLESAQDEAKHTKQVRAQYINKACVIDGWNFSLIKWCNVASDSECRSYLSCQVESKHGRVGKACWLREVFVDTYVRCLLSNFLSRSFIGTYRQSKSHSKPRNVWNWKDSRTMVHQSFSINLPGWWIARCHRLHRPWVASINGKDRITLRSQAGFLRESGVLCRSRLRCLWWPTFYLCRKIRLD